MRARLGGKQLTIGLVALLASVALSGFAGGAASGSAATALASAAKSSGAAALATSLAAPVERNKIVLPETSIDGPAFWTNIPTGEPGAGGNSIIAWTGTDAAHHVNTVEFRQESGGYSFTNKKILDETSIAGPAVTVQPSQIHPIYYFVAWTGTNQAHSLNVICDGCASNRIKLTLRDETSFAAPAIAMLDGKLMLAWTGTDANHSLNILPISITDGRFVVGQKMILEMFSSNAGPALAYEPDTAVGRGIVLSWSDRATQKIRMALSSTGTDWPRAGQFTLSEWSDATPNLLAFVPTVDVAHSYLAWRGIDPAHSVNLLYPAYTPMTNATKATLDETSLGGPALGSIGGARVAIVWTGTDSLHHLNFATIDV